MKTNFNSAAIIAVILLLAIPIQRISPWPFYAADRAVLDWEYQFLSESFPRPIDKSKDVVIIGIDELAYKQIKEPFALWHEHLGALLAAMAEAKPSVFALDIVLPDRSYFFMAPRFDQSLLQGLLKIKSEKVPLVLGQTLDDTGGFRAIFSPYVSIAGKESLASVMACLDNDGVARGFDVATCPTLATGKTLAEQVGATLGKAQKIDGMIDFNRGDAFAYVPFSQVLSWYQNGEQDKLISTFRGKPVLLGVVMPYMDRISTPRALFVNEPESYRVPGVMLHAQTIRSILSQGLIGPTPMGWIGLALLLASLFWFGKHSAVKLVLLSGFIALLGTVSVWALYSGVFFPISVIVVVAILATGVRFLRDYRIDQREKNSIREAFSGYVSPQILSEIMSGGLSQGLGGGRKKVCILFSDIRGFTTYCENKSPEEIIAMLNEYFTEMTSVIHEYGGTVDKFIGDGLMAFFGAPKSLEFPEKNAFLASKEMLRRLHVLNERFYLRGLPPIQIGVGLHSGDALIGHVGSSTRHDYTAVGDVVNTTSRIEGLTKDLGYPILCSDAVVKVLGDSEVLVDLGEKGIKGRSNIHVYGWKP